MRFLPLIIFSIFSCTLIFQAQPVLTARLTIDNSTGFLDKTVAPTGLEKSTVTDTAGRLIKALLGATAIIFFALMVYGGFLWMTDRGSEEQITKAKNTIIAAVIGITVVTAAYAITTLVTSRLVEKTKGAPTVDPGNVGGEPLGCCVLFTGPNVRACRIDTNRECLRRAQILEQNQEVESSFINWSAGVDAVQCSNQC